MHKQPHSSGEPVASQMPIGSYGARPSPPDARQPSANHPIADPPAGDETFTCCLLADIADCSCDDGASRERYLGDREIPLADSERPELDQKIIGNLLMEGSEVEAHAFLMGLRHLYRQQDVSLLG